MPLYLRRAMTALVFGIAGSAHAVSRNSHGEGQVLLFPYYTTSAGNVTLLGIVNGSDDAKVLSVRFASGRFGATAAQLNLYLGPNDAWSATIFARGIDSPGLVAGDVSCTWPDLQQSTELPHLPDGRVYLSFTPAWPDADAKWTGEGFIEVVEVATIVPSTPTYEAVLYPGVQRRCARIGEAWQSPDGYWLREPLRDLANPTGGISGTASIVNVAQGTMLTMQSVALDEFRVDPADRPRGSRASVALHPQPWIHAPSLLGKALSDPASGLANASLRIDGKTIDATYPAATQAVDAVAAVLSAAELRGDYDDTQAIGAATSFVLTHPLRAFYASSELAAPLPPYRFFMGHSNSLRLSSGMAFRAYEANQWEYVSSPRPEGCGWLCPPMPHVRTPDTVVEVLAPSGRPDPLLGTRYHGDIGMDFEDGPRPLAYRGPLVLEPGLLWPNETFNHLLRPSREGWRFVGLPLIGIQVSNYINANAAPGVLANYSFARAMVVRQACVKTGGAACVP